ncbi:MAG: LysM peptidoglycan-binding domain-containing M23 family metallopeptidase [Candidatus Omnitrophica bacterium]|nr:LysM peptidoglycan-binding domain-containing M23 family metallopeptidase [Candidatus Omnitrophota bacterium]
MVAVWTTPVSAESVDGVYHIVRQTDTLPGIAQKYGVSARDITGSNRLKNKYSLTPGERLFIPRVSQAERLNSLHPAAAVHQMPSSFSVPGEQFAWPVKGTVILRFDSLRQGSRNNGIDIQAPYGTAVVSARSGTVSYCALNLKGYGKTIIIDHGDGFQTVYSYNAENLAVQGASVRQGDVIAKVGQGGRAAGPSLHFEIRKKQVPLDPMQYLR